MKKKINIQFMGIAALAILTTLILITMVFYELFQKQVMDELKSYAHLLMLTVSSDEQWEQVINHETWITDHVRLTKIDADGKVAFDSSTDIAQMDKNTFYYAVSLADGSILRVEKKADSFFCVAGSVLPTMVFAASALFLVCIGLSHMLTKSLMEPIQKMAANLDDKDEIIAYEEMAPFIHTIQKQHEDIIKSSKMRQEFTANVSHELKTPLTAISGYSELIENHMVSEEDVARFAAEIHKNSNRLLTLINDIIRLSELDGEESELTFEKVNLYVLAQTCVDMLQMNAKKHHVSLYLEGRECYIHANRQMMEEVLYNLCDNAIRYNNQGGTVCVSVYPNIREVVLSVKDTGIGIPKEYQERVFERFYRVDKSRSKSTGGTGLGLAIVKHIVARHEARLYLESEPEKGTTITIEFSN